MPREPAAPFTRLLLSGRASACKGSVRRGRPPSGLPVRDEGVTKCAEAAQVPERDRDGPPSRNTLSKTYHRARQVAGRPDLRFHDLRHSAATMAAQAGATLAELMARMGHSTAKAALVYQHVAEGRDRIIADRMALLAQPAVPGVDGD